MTKLSDGLNIHEVCPELSDYVMQFEADLPAATEKEKWEYVVDVLSDFGSCPNADWSVKLWERCCRELATAYTGYTPPVVLEPYSKYHPPIGSKHGPHPLSADEVHGWDWADELPF